MRLFNHKHRAVRRFVAKDEGATAVEFAIVLPVMLVCFALIVEGSRIYWNYQAAVGGVRDAARYLARVTDNDVCGAATPSLGITASDDARTSIDRNLTSGSGTSAICPSAVALSTTTPPPATLQCVGTDVTGLANEVPVVQVNATVVVTLPMSNLLKFFIATPNGAMVSTITDQSRVYGI